MPENFESRIWCVISGSCSIISCIIKLWEPATSLGSTPPCIMQFSFAVLYIDWYYSGSQGTPQEQIGLENTNWLSLCPFYIGYCNKNDMINGVVHWQCFSNSRAILLFTIFNSVFFMMGSKFSSLSRQGAG